MPAIDYAEAQAELERLFATAEERFRQNPEPQGPAEAIAAVNSGSLNRFGMYLPPSASIRAAVIADRIEAFNSAAVWRAFEQHKLEFGGP